MTHSSHVHRLLAAAALALSLAAAGVRANSVQDIARLQGHEPVRLQGLGLVAGLNGTGDSMKDALPTARSVASYLENLGCSIQDVTELLKVRQAALVTVTLEVPPAGAAEGDVFDVRVASMMNAKSLEGGTLIGAWLRLPRRDDPSVPIVAYAEGRLTAHPANPATAVVHAGGQLLRAIENRPLQAGELYLVLDPDLASIPNADMLATEINAEFAESSDAIATPLGATRVHVRIPEVFAGRPHAFASALLTTRIQPSLIQSRPRIVLDEANGIIAIRGDVKIEPAAVASQSISITEIVPPPVPTVDQPDVRVRRSAVLDTTGQPSRTATRLADLVAAFDALQVPVAEQIALIRQLDRAGAIHVEVIEQ